VPFTPIALFRTSSIEITPLSRALVEAGFAAAGHAHDWWLIRGGGNRIVCALGPRHAVFQAVADQRIPRLIRAAHRCRQTDFAGRVARCLFQRETSSGVRIVAGLAPESEFSSEADFAAWLGEHAAFFDSCLAPQ
jgi:hypothetical protein